MKHHVLCGSIWMLLATTFPITSLSSWAEAHCPASLPGLHPRVVAGALLVVPIKVNGAGPFDFMVDTGSQLNVIDPALANQLQLKSQATVNLVETSAVSQASLVILDSLEAGSSSVAQPLAAVQDLAAIQTADPRIRGVLGENFLAHFDVLLDYRSRLVCLDRTGAMQNALRGERVPLISPKHLRNEIPFTRRLVVSVNLSDTGDRQILLQLDSGSDGPILYSGNPKLQDVLLKRASLQGPDVSNARRAFAALPPQDMKLGERLFRRVPFVTPIRAANDDSGREEDGILASVLFQRLYVSHSGQFVIFDPK